MTVRSTQQEISSNAYAQETLAPRRAADWWKRLGILCLILGLTAMVSPAQGEQPSAPIFTTLHSFDGTDGACPEAALVQATNGDLYGTTYCGGANGYGTVFKITSSGTLTRLHSFDYTDGAYPDGAVAQATDGNFYGTTSQGGANPCNGNGCGTVFKITPSGALTTLLSFNGTDGDSPSALIQAPDGSLYGTTADGGANGLGTVFKITTNGTLTTLFSFNGTDGGSPSALIQATDGNFYGTTADGGANDSCFPFPTCGTVFKITPSGTLTTLHSFDGTDGDVPVAALVQATDGYLYGTTSAGGADESCLVLGGPYGCGTVFKITTNGTLTTQLFFDDTDGANPAAALVQATDGNFYGTTLHGGANGACPSPDGFAGCGTVFKITPNRTLATLHSFDSTDGAHPEGALVQDTNGSFYGTTFNDGANFGGTVFSLSAGLGPFVETQTTSGKVGAAVKILGTDLTGATSVSFNGKAAVFKVASSSEITTTVPAGATTGFVTVTTPSGTLKSNVRFQVRP
jgi:uncharacterized repeat protein (TIGR03803 family)